MKKANVWLVLDCSYLAYRSYEAMPELEHDSVPTTVVFNMLQDLMAWRDLFSSRRVIFCFDAGKNKRYDLYPEYKGNRVFTEEEKEKRVKLYEQLERLRMEDLFRLGFRNVLWADGFEADDVIATVCMHSIPKGDHGVIIASDGDLYQLLSSRISMFDPTRKKVKDVTWFAKTYGIFPSQWADVKAIAGCPTDNVKGIPGVGEKSAIAYLTETMNPKHKRYQAIADNVALWKEMLKLVKLPFDGTPKFELQEDKVSEKRWERFCKSYGLKTIRGFFDKWDS